MTRQAQAQAQKQETIAYTESLELVRCLLRVSVFHISYLRGLFPEDHFKGVDMTNLDGMNIKMLLPACEESKRLIDWVEAGVFDAIRCGYLKSMFFGIARDAEASDLLEEYIFTFNYAQDDGQVSMDLIQRNGRTGAKKPLHATDQQQNSNKGSSSVEAVKYQVVRLMRMLVQICQTLDRVPHERYLFMKLTYYGHTPDEYEPPYFAAVEPGGGVGHFARKPFTMDVGKVNTNHHGLTMKVKSTLDCCDDDPEGDDEEGQEAEGMASREVSMSLADELHDALGQEVAPHSTKQHQADQRQQGVSAAEYEAVKAYVIRDLQTHRSLDFSDALSVFLDISPPDMEAVFKKLQRDGIVQPDDLLVHTYRAGAALQQQQGAAAGRQAADQLAHQMQGGLAVTKASGAATPGGGHMVNDDGGDDTRAGRDQQADAGGAQDDQAAKVGKTRVRKASYVSDPIHQQHTGKKARRGGDTEASTGGRKGR